MTNSNRSAGGGAYVLASVFALAGLMGMVAGSAFWTAVGLAGTAFFWYIGRASAEMERDRTEKDRLEQIRLHQVRWDYLIGRHGEEIAARCDAGELWIGQTADQLRDSYGEPEAIDEKVLKTRHREVWKYDEIGRNRYNTRVTLDDGVVAGWDKKED